MLTKSVKALLIVIRLNVAIGFKGHFTESV